MRPAGPQAGLSRALGGSAVRRLQLVSEIAKRRRAAALAYYLIHIAPHSLSNRRRKTPFHWQEHSDSLNESEFRGRYRLTKVSFDKLLRLLQPDLLPAATTRWASRNRRNANGGKEMEPAAMLAAALRYMAGGAVGDIKLIYKISKTEVYRCLWRVMDAINARLRVDFKVDDVQRLRQLEAGFRARSPQQVWRGQVGAVDGCHIAILAPPPHVPERKKYFVARKNKFVLLLIAVADADSRIIYYDISQVPTTHDSLAWATSSLGQQVGRGDLPEPFFFSGDSAFSLSPSMVVPSSGTQFFDDAFDFVQSSERMPIECAFGILVRRWGMFWRPLAVRFDRLAPLIGAMFPRIERCRKRIG